MKVNISDNQKHLEFAPLTHLKPLAKLWVGCLTIEERWKKYLSASEIGYVTEPYLSEKFFPLSDADLTVNANIIPNAELVDFLLNAKSGIILKSGQEIARKGSSSEAIEYSGEILVLNKRWDLYLLNNKVLEADYALLTAHRKSEELSPSNTLIGRPDRLFIEKGAVVEGAILNTKDGPIYISKDSEIMEGSLVRGPFFLGEHAALKMGTKMYGATTIGPYSKIGGEVSNCVVQCFSNKGHDGFIGNALIGEWCNLGADTNSSNLKNNYSTIRTYNYASAGEEESGQQFMGLTMGDHSKCGINTMFNTATVVGTSVNIYGGDFPVKYIPSFSWGGQSFENFKWEKALEAANGMMVRRGRQLDEQDLRILRHIYDMQ